MSIEDFVPTLARGAHNSPEEGACVMEMVSFLAGEEWSDMPKCTSEFISLIAQLVNDSVETRNRHLILRDFDRLFNTNIPSWEYNEFYDEVRKRLGGMSANAKVHTLAKNKLSLYFQTRANALTYDHEDFAIQDEIDLEMLRTLTTVLDIYDEMFRPAPAPKQDMTKLKELFVS